MATPVHPRPCDSLAKWLGREHMWCTVHEHRATFTAMSTACSQGVEARSFMKVVAVEADDGRRALIAVEAPDRVDLDKARRRLGAGRIGLLDEAEALALAPECEAGAIPAVGELFGVPTYADVAVQQHERVSFDAGSHRCSVSVDRREWERSAHVHYGDLIVEEGAAWAPV